MAVVTSGLPVLRKRAWGLCKSLCLSDAQRLEVIKRYGGNTSFKDLDGPNLSRAIQELSQRKDVELNPMRKKIVHLLCVLGYVTAKNTPDVARIDVFIRGIGSNNPKMKPLHWLDKNELLKVLNQVEARAKKS